MSKNQFEYLISILEGPVNSWVTFNFKETTKAFSNRRAPFPTSTSSTALATHQMVFFSISKSNPYEVESHRGLLLSVLLLSQGIVQTRPALPQNPTLQPLAEFDLHFNTN